MGAVVVHGEQLNPPPGVVLPEKHGLVIDELAALRIDNLPAKVLVLQEVEEVQTGRVFNESCVLRLLPVQEVL